MMDFVLKMMDFAFKMMDVVLTMMDLQGWQACLDLGYWNPDVYNESEHVIVGPGAIFDRFCSILDWFCSILD